MLTRLETLGPEPFLLLLLHFPSLLKPGILVAFAFSRPLEAGNFSHKKTLFHTGAHFRGWIFAGQGKFPVETVLNSNEIKDLRQLAEVDKNGNSDWIEVLT